MPWILPGCIFSVMASHTRGRCIHFRMVEGRDYRPGHGDMAGSTIISSGNMVVVFARRQGAIVAKNAGCAGSAVVHNHTQAKPAWVMADAALFGGGDVVEMRAARKFPVVTTIALLRYPFKNSVLMTGFARNQLVPTDQGKAGGEVVEHF